MIRTHPIYTRHVRLPGPSVHSFTPPPPAVPPLVFKLPNDACAHVESAHSLRWVQPGKFTWTVTFDRWPIAQEGHDAGTLIPHVAIPPNAGLVMTILTSKYKPLFCSGSVSADGKAVATYLPVLAPPQFCNVPCSLPATATPFNCIVPFPNTVGVGMSLKDFLLGWLAVATESAADLVFTLLFAGNETAKSVVEDSVIPIAKELAKPIVKQLIEDLAKDVTLRGLKRALTPVPIGPVRRFELPFLGQGLEYDSERKELRVGPPGAGQRLDLDLGAAGGPRAPTPGLTLPAGTPTAR